MPSGRNPCTLCSVIYQIAGPRIVEAGEQAVSMYNLEWMSRLSSPQVSGSDMSLMEGKSTNIIMQVSFPHSMRNEERQLFTLSTVTHRNEPQ